MSRWQISKVFFYSHDARRVEIEFNLNDATIIVGESNSGKSAIIEAIDYAMGSTECQIPGIVGDACSWVGVLWCRGKMQILMCRRLPPLLANTCSEMYYDAGTAVTVPATADDIKSNSNVNGALHEFEQKIAMADVVGVTKTERKGKRISIRNAMPYVLISDDIIINKVTLLRGMAKWRQSLIDSLPYFMGAVDETTAAKEIALRKLRTKLAKEERRREAANLVDEASLNKGKELLLEAVEVGILAPTTIESLSPSQIKAELGKVASWTPATQSQTGGTDQLSTLYSLERDAVAELAKHRANHAAARSAIQTVSDFTTAAQEQKVKIGLVDFFNPKNEAHSCPLCNAELGASAPAISTVKSALKQLDTELKEVGEDRPQIDRYIQRLDTKVDESVGLLKRIKGQITAIVREEQNNAKRLDADPRRMRVVGRVSFFIEQTAEDPDQLNDSKYNDLLSSIEDLQSEVDPKAKAERVMGLQYQVSQFATGIMKDMPFDAAYRDVQVMFNATDLTVKYTRGPRVMPMQRVGGDESYLTGRLSTIFGLHRVFAEGKRPVPGVVVLDQVSRPFYKPDEVKGEVVLKSTDNTDLKEYFDAIFKEIDEQKLQVIVLEHAYFNDFPRYQKAVIRRWNGDGKLIPFDWPLMQVDGTLSYDPHPKDDDRRGRKQYDDKPAPEDDDEADE